MTAGWGKDTSDTGFVSETRTQGAETMRQETGQ